MSIERLTYLAGSELFFIGFSERFTALARTIQMP
jgi:hypothetical protein